MTTSRIDPRRLQTLLASGAWRRGVVVIASVLGGWLVMKPGLTPPGTTADLVQRGQ